MQQTFYFKSQFEKDQKDAIESPQPLTPKLVPIEDKEARFIKSVSNLQSPVKNKHLSGHK